MLELNYIRENSDVLKERLKVRNADFSSVIDEIISKDINRRTSQNELDNGLAEANRLAKEIGGLFKSGKVEEANAAKSKTSELKVKNAELKEQLTQIEDELLKLLYQIPNQPTKDVPKGKSDQDNELILENANEIKLPENAAPHWELAAKYDLIDFDLGVKIAGAGFPVYKGKGARLQRALINFFLDEADESGYKEFIPPHLVNEASGYGTGQLPDKEGQMYYVEADDLYLIPTGEIPLTNMFRGEIVNKDHFPIKVTGYSPCFRREAGSYGKDVRGLNRLHQFDKVEIVEVAHPDSSYDRLQEMIKHVESLIVKLGLPYRIVKLCGGDLGFTAAFTYDFEVYSAAQERWLEVSSVSNFETYQANRLKLRFKDEDGKTKLAHTLNGSALALPRIMAAILENNQCDDGINIPEVLVKYTGFNKI